MFYLFAFLEFYMEPKLTLNPRFHCIILRVALGLTTIGTGKVGYAFILYNFNTHQSVYHCIRWCALAAWLFHCCSHVCFLPWLSKALLTLDLYITLFHFNLMILGVMKSIHEILRSVLPKMVILSISRSLSLKFY